MSQRKPTRTRGAKARPRRVPAAPAQETVGELKPFKVVGTLVGARFNKDGGVVGEEPMGSITIYAPEFGRFEELLLGGLAAASAEGVSSGPSTPSS